MEEKRREEIKKVFDEIENTLNKKCKEVRRGSDGTIIADRVDISYSGSYNFGRFGSQSKNWIEMRAWIGGSVKQKRVQFEKFELTKVVTKVLDLAGEIEAETQRRESAERERNKWKAEIAKEFGNVRFPSYSGRKFEIVIEEKTEERGYPEYLVVEDGCIGYEIEGCNKVITKDKLKRIVKILKEEN